MVKKHLSTGLLFFQMLVAWAFYHFRGWKLVLESDSKSYLEYSPSTLVDALEHSRTFGYPLFLELFQTVFPLSWLAEFQLLFHFFAVWVLYRGFTSWSGSQVAALLVASPIIFAKTIRDWGFFVLTDGPGFSLLVLLIGLTILLASARRITNWLWPGIGITCFAVWIIRPSYVYLAGVVPLIFWLIQTKRNWKQLRTLSAVTLLPVILFCAIRGIAVGHFGLTPHGAIILSCLTAQMTTEEVLPRLSPKAKELAQGIISLRAENARIVSSADPKKIETQRQKLFSQIGTFRTVGPYEDFAHDSRYCAEPLLSPRNFDFKIWNRCINYSIFTLTLSSAIQIHGKDIKKITKAIGEFSSEVIRARPHLYALWIIKSFLKGTTKNLSKDFGFILSLLLLLLTEAVLVFGGIQRRKQEPLERAYKGIFQIAIIIFFFGNLLVFLMQPPISRFFDCNSAFIQSVLLVLAGSRALSIWEFLKKRWL